MADSENKRTQLLKFAQKRAIEYLDAGDKRNALTSFASDSRKWKLFSEKQQSFIDSMCLRGMMSGDVDKEFFLGFN